MRWHENQVAWNVVQMGDQILMYLEVARVLELLF